VPISLPALIRLLVPVLVLVATFPPMPLVPVLLVVVMVVMVVVVVLMVVVLRVRGWFRIGRRILRRRWLG
jgi:hypothetical protein